MGAQREGIKTLIFPEPNRKDVEKLPDFIKNDLEVHYVKEYSDVFKLLFPWGVLLSLNSCSSYIIKQINGTLSTGCLRGILAHPPLGA